MLGNDQKYHKRNDSSWERDVWDKRMLQQVEENSVARGKPDDYGQQHPGSGTQVVKPIHSSLPELAIVLIMSPPGLRQEQSANPRFPLRHSLRYSSRPHSAKQRGHEA